MASVKVGFPLLDDGLLAFSQSLPNHYKLKGLRLRWFFKEALRGFLPDEVITKKKQGFGLPFGVWATTHPPLAKLAADSLYGLVERGIDMEVVGFHALGFLALGGLEFLLGIELHA